jgi:FKBP-type peptidyl-prolyl cis-trans isomerase
VVGTCPTARPTDTVNVRYVGALYGGTPFDSSWSRGDTPISFPLNQEVVPGFAQGIEGMAPGGRRVIVIPPALGYGEQTQGPIPGGSTLVFVVDLVGIN